MPIQGVYSLKVFIVFVAAFPTGPSICLLGGGGGQQASSLSSKHKLWNFHRYSLVCIIIIGFCMADIVVSD